jgi:hypothetical protein
MWSPAFRKDRTDEAIEVHGRANRGDPAGAGGGHGDRRVVSEARVSGATFYKWKAEFGGLDVSEAKRLKALEDENAKLKRLLADAMLRQCRPEGTDRKKMVTSAARREAVAVLRKTLEVSEPRACTMIGICRMTVRYRSTRPGDGCARSNEGAGT